MQKGVLNMLKNPLYCLLYYDNPLFVLPFGMACLPGTLKIVLYIIEV